MGPEGNFRETHVNLGPTPEQNTPAPIEGRGENPFASLSPAETGNLNTFLNSYHWLIGGLDHPVFAHITEEEAQTFKDYAEAATKEERKELSPKVEKVMERLADVWSD